MCAHTMYLGQVVMVHTFKHSTEEAEAGGAPWVWGQHGLMYLEKIMLLLMMPSNSQTKIMF